VGRLIGGPINLQRLLTAGLVSILFLSFLLTAAGVALLVRGYLWRTGVEDLQGVAQPVERFLKNRPPESSDGRRRWRDERGERRGERGQNLVNRGVRRFSQGRGELYLLKDGVIERGIEEGAENLWGRAFSGLPNGVHVLDHQGVRWQVLSRQIQDPEYDQIVVARRWSPDLRVVRTLVGFQVLTMTLVLGLAVLAVRALARRIVGPLEELRAWSERLGEAKMEKLNESNIAEVSSLQGSFTQMGHRVESALEAHRRFVADASHELKTPLTAISGMLELVESRPEMSPEDRKQALAVAKTETSRMATLVSDLLILSRAQARRSGKKELRILAPLVEEQLTTLRVLFPDQEFLDQLDGQATWSVNSDAFARIVRNLVENAANHAGGKPIEIRLQRCGPDISLQVIDRGPGIAADKLPQLFQRFYRMDDGRSREQGGFGLGLAIVKALVEEVGGELSCQSTPGQGTCFTVLLKVATPR
jgi:signal transduction histidine kinase